MRDMCQLFHKTIDILYIIINALYAIEQWQTIPGKNASAELAGVVNYA